MPTLVKCRVDDEPECPICNGELQYLTDDAYALAVARDDPKNPIWVFGDKAYVLIDCPCISGWDK